MTHAFRRMTREMMNEIAHDYLIPDGTSSQDIKGRIQARSRFSEERPQEVTKRFLDSFDWSLYLEGVAVEERRDRGRHLLLWHDLRTDAAPCVQDIRDAPGFAWDLPPGPLRERVQPVLGVRRLLSLVEVRSRVQTLRLLNDDDKTVARLSLEESRFNDPSREREGPLALRLRLTPVKGYEDAFHETAQALDRDLGLEYARTPVFLEALAACGRRPGDYSSGLDYHLDPDKRADATTKEILLGLLDTLEANIEGTKANLDSEFLHDLRVATRRMRSGLTQIKGVFAPDIVEDYKERFAWVQQITGPVRDLDVYLLDFGGYQKGLPLPLQPHLEPLRGFLFAQYEQAQKAMVRELGSAKFRHLLKAWRVFLEAPVPERSALPNATRAVKIVADERIWRMYRRVRKEGRAIMPDSPAPELHELRKSCKKLRYLLEFFQSLYSKQDVRGLIKLLKVLLDNLGGFQDLAVQADHLRDMAQRMRDEDRADTDTLLTMGVLVGDLLNRQQRARVEFAEIFEKFDRKPNRDLFRSLFAPESESRKDS
ncbi:MAG: CHAD domain-containing protein [Pseudomonadota bacterium]|nr:CHAD domain-containing protein [Pseudomonadota bacterium]